MYGLIADVRFGLRSWRRAPALALLLIATLALGIGATSAGFSLVYHLLVRPIDLPEMESLVAVQSRDRSHFEFEPWDVSPRRWRDWQGEARSFDALAAGRSKRVALGGDGAPEQVIAYQVSPEFFGILRVPAALGRVLAADETEDANVVVLGDALWRSRYGGDPAVVGRSVSLEGRRRTVVGVMPKTFRYPSQAELWIPLALSAEEREARDARSLEVIGRLRPGKSVAEADAEMQTIAARQAELHPETDGQRAVRVVGFARGLEKDSAQAFIHTLAGAGVFVLLIAVANAANLLLARASARRREIALRAALGATRGRLVRQLLTEGLLISSVAGAFAIVVAVWALDVIRGSLPETTTMFIPGWEGISVDLPVLAVTAAVALATTLPFGLVPALRVSAVRAGEALKEGGRSIAGTRGAARVESALIVAEVTLALVLLVGAAGFVSAFTRLANPRRGMDPRDVLTFRVTLPDARYDAAKIVAFQGQALDALRTLPGVLGAAVVSDIPTAPGKPATFEIDGRPARSNEPPWADYRPVSPGYLDLLRVPIRSGRALTSGDDRADAAPVALVSEQARRSYWGSEDPIGSRIRVTRGGRVSPWLEVVGVVGDVGSPLQPDWPRTIYVPATTAPPGAMYFVLRTSGSPLAAGPAARSAIYRIDGEIPVTQLQTLEQAFSARLGAARLGSVMMSLLASLALFLSVVGIYGLVSYLVELRRSEIGVRLALGASRGRLIRFVMKRGARLSALGALVGLPLAFGLFRWFERVAPDQLDLGPATFVVLAACVVGAALLGAFVPARRATGVDPLVALRSE